MIFTERFDRAHLRFIPPHRRRSFNDSNSEFDPRVRSFVAYK